MNKIYCMDCLEGMKQLEDNSVDLVLTDPPYNLNKDFKNDNLSEEEFINFLTPIFNELCRIIKPKHSIIILFMLILLGSIMIKVVMVIVNPIIKL